MEFPEIMDGDPFDIFFDNEALSDRTLYIVEVEEVVNISCDAGTNKRKLTVGEGCPAQQTCEKKYKRSESDPCSFSKDVPINNVEKGSSTSFTDERRQESVNTDDIPVIEIDAEEVTESVEVAACSDEELTNIENEESSSVDVQPIKVEETGESITCDVKSEQLFQIVEQTCSTKENAFSSVLSNPENCNNVPNDQGNVIEKNIIKSTKVHVHSVILAAKSSFFNCLFSSGMRETNEKEIKVQVRKGETEPMLILLRCFYNKQHINNHDLNTVLEVCFLAMRYCYDGLISACLDFLSKKAKTLVKLTEINKIVLLVSAMENQLPFHQSKCANVKKMCAPVLIYMFSPLDECLEKTPGKFIQLPLCTLNLFLEPNVQHQINIKHKNLFVYCMQAWLKSRESLLMEDAKFKSDVLIFIEKLLSVVDTNHVTGDFLTNVMTCENSPFSIWSGYKDWYINKLQECIYTYGIQNSLTVKPYMVLKRKRYAKFVRQENDADIFSLVCPIILNGFEIGIYLRGRQSTRLQILCKCKNMLQNKQGFGKSSLAFRLNGSIKLNGRPNTWSVPFPAPSREWFQFRYKHNTMFAEMYELCKLRSDIYTLAKQFGFVVSFQLQQIN